MVICTFILTAQYIPVAFYCLCCWTGPGYNLVFGGSDSVGRLGLLDPQQCLKFSFKGGGHELSSFLCPYHSPLFLAATFSNLIYRWYGIFKSPPSDLMFDSKNENIKFKTLHSISEWKVVVVVTLSSRSCTAG